MKALHRPGVAGVPGLIAWFGLVKAKMTIPSKGIYSTRVRALSSQGSPVWSSTQHRRDGR